MFTIHWDLHNYFTKIVLLRVLYNQGYSNSLLNYQFSDKSPLNGINYYRLNWVDEIIKALTV
jgi:hypothetical protein